MRMFSRPVLRLSASRVALGILGGLGASLLTGAALATPASAAVAISFTQGSPDTMQLAVSGINETYNVQNPDTGPGQDYTIDTTCSGCSNSTITVGPSVPAGLCTPASGTTVVCGPAEPGDSAYRLKLTNDATRTMDVLLSDSVPSVTTFSFPAPVIVNADAAATVRNLTGTDLTFNGGGGGDTYAMGTGIDLVHGGGGVDTVSYANGGCATVTLDGVANDTQSCGGAPGTFENVFNDVENVTGGPGIDTITGNAGPNVLSGGGAKDVLDGGEGTNVLHADSGGALMQGGLGNDTFDGDPGGGGDVSYANHPVGIVGVTLNGVADDGVLGSESDNLDADITKITGNNVVNLLDGSAATFAVTLIGGDGPDTLTGSDGSDSIDGGGGADTINAGLGNDVVTPGPGTDIYNGGGGSGDRLDYSGDAGGMNLSINDGTNDGEGGLENVGATFENLFGGSGDDTLTGDVNANTLAGNGGTDTIDGKGGADLIVGDPVLGPDGKCDLLRGGAGNDSFNIPFDTGCNTTLDYSDHLAAVTISLNSAASPQLVATGETDTFAGNFVDVIGTAQPDTIAVSNAGGPHTLTGGLGNDTLSGAPGGADASSYADRAVPVAVDLDGVNDDGQVGEADILSNIDNLIGGSAADTLTGDVGDNVLTGGLGNDVLGGGPGGSDTASYAERSVPVSADLDGVNDDGQAGEADTLTAIDNLVGGSAADTLALGSSPGKLIGGDGGDTLGAGSAGGSAIDAGNGDDSVEARNSAADTIACGAGVDPVRADAVDILATDCDRQDTTAPQTSISGSPKAKVTSKRRRVKVKFTFKSSEPGASFDCKLDKGSFRSCKSPFRKSVGRGKHTFSVRATDAVGNVDSTPAVRRWRVIAPKRR